MQALRDAEDAAERADVLAHEQHLGVVEHRLAEAGVDGLASERFSVSGASGAGVVRPHRTDAGLSVSVMTHLLEGALVRLEPRALLHERRARLGVDVVEDHVPVGAGTSSARFRASEAKSAALRLDVVEEDGATPRFSSQALRYA